MQASDIMEDGAMKLDTLFEIVEDHSEELSQTDRGAQRSFNEELLKDICLGKIQIVLNACGQQVTVVNNQLSLELNTDENGQLVLNELDAGSAEAPIAVLKRNGRYIFAESSIELTEWNDASKVEYLNDNAASFDSSDNTFRPPKQLNKKYRKRRKWKDAHVIELIKLYRINATKLHNAKRTRHLYDTMAKQLTAMGVPATGDEVHVKINNLRQRYQQEKKSLRPSWNFFHQLDEILDCE